jgi:hypothetical protein
MKQPSQLCPGFADCLAGVLQLSIDVADGDLGAKHVDLGGRGCAVTITGDLEEVFGKRAILFQECLRPFIEMQVKIRSLDVGHDVKLSRGQLEKGDLHIVLGGLAPQFQGPAPGKLLGQQGGIGHVTHE